MKEGLEKQLKLANNEVDRLQRLVADKTEELEQLQSGNMDLSDVQTRHRTEIETFKKKLKDRDREKEEMVEERNGLLHQIQDLKHKLNEASKQDNGLTEDMMNEVHFYQTEVDSLKGKIVNYETMYEEMTQMNQILSQQAKEGDSKKKDLENQIKTLEQRLGDSAALGKELDEAKAKITKLEAELRKYTDGLDDTDKKLKTANSKYIQIESEYSELQTKYDKINRDKIKTNDELEELRAKVELLEKKIQVKDDEIKRLGDKLSNLKNE